MSDLNGKIALVTGASKGIGASIARLLAGRGATVAVNYASDADGANKVVGEIEAAGGKAIAIGASVSVAAEVARMFSQVARLGNLDILVNNAGQYNVGPVETFTEETYHRIFDTNVLGTLLVTQASLQHFGETGGSIVNISSSIVRSANPMSPVYGASKAAVDYLTRMMAAELVTRKIRVNAVLPGMTETENARASGVIDQPLIDFVSARTILSRVGLPDDIALAVGFLVSDEARWVTGELIGANGGFY